MQADKVIRTVTVAAPNGLHATSACLIAKRARDFSAQVTLVRLAPQPDEYRVNATDVLQMLSLGAARGVQLQIEAHGDQAAEAADAIVELIANMETEEQKLAESVRANRRPAQ